MRLINISHPDKLEFYEVADPSHVRYVILSHVWNKDDGHGRYIPEPTFHDLLTAMQRPSEHLAAPKFAKLLRFICAAAEDGYHLVWADMCCIDKTSSAEVSESIASMYVWYSCAEVCYAYLNDVPSGQHGSDTLAPVLPEEFRRSRWFTRGWTLQELIAPKSLVFFSQDWVALGTKRGLARIIQQITFIDVEVLAHERELSSITVACRMSWAANRTTERLEDRAYSLMGLFGVRIPVLYGERGYAFIRLQREILKRIADLTLLAWGPRRPLSDLLVESAGGPKAERSEEALQSLHVRARRERSSPSPEWDPGYLLATSPDAFSHWQTNARPSAFGPTPLRLTRTAYRGSGPASQHIAPFDFYEMHVSTIPFKMRPDRTNTGDAASGWPSYLVPLGCSTADDEPLALLLTPSPNHSASSMDHFHWVIGVHREGPDCTPFHCRIVTLPRPPDDPKANTHLLTHYQGQETAQTASQQVVCLPLSAPMGDFSGPDAVSPLCEYGGHFDVYLSRRSRSTMEAAGFIFSTGDPRIPPSDAYVVQNAPRSVLSVCGLPRANWLHELRKMLSHATTWLVSFLLTRPTNHYTPPSEDIPTRSVLISTPTSLSFCVEQLEDPVTVAAVNRFKINFAACTRTANTGTSTSSLVGSIIPLWEDSSVIPSWTPAGANRSCTACGAPEDDHIMDSKFAWSRHAGFAVCTLELRVHPQGNPDAAREVPRSFKVSVVLRALPTVPSGPSAQPNHDPPQPYLLEIEYYATPGLDESTSPSVYATAESSSPAGAIADNVSG